MSARWATRCRRSVCLARVVNSTILFYKPALSWPFASGHDVHTTQMCRAMHRLGVRTVFVTDGPIDPGALPFIEADAYACLDQTPSGESASALSRLQERFRGYWGISDQRIRTLADIARSEKADTVVVSGLGVLPMLGALPAATTRVWYAADEWVLHHLSLMRASTPSTWKELKPALVKGIYERAYRTLVDRVWVVTERDARSMRLVMGPRGVDLLPNGVDAEYYTSELTSPQPRSAVFWGRLDFEPNVQAVMAFARQVWPRVRRQFPDATWRIVGFKPTADVLSLDGHDGIVVQPDVPDIRPVVANASVVVLPLISGAGIKNKFLEAAAMGRPIVATALATLGLRGEPPARIVAAPEEWVTALAGLWDDEAAALALGSAARKWATTNHAWHTVADDALKALASNGRGR